MDVVKMRLAPAPEGAVYAWPTCDQTGFRVIDWWRSRGVPAPAKGGPLFRFSSESEWPDITDQKRRELKAGDPVTVLIPVDVFLGMVGPDAPVSLIYRGRGRSRTRSG